MCKVSICVPAYNNAGEVERLLQSIREQDFTDWELVLTDDSTNTEIEELLKRTQMEWTELSDRLCYVHNDKPLGHIFNWNKALSLAKGDFIKIMFSDDWFTYSYSLGRMVKLLEDAPQVLLAFCATMQVGKDSYARHAGVPYLDRLKKDYRNLFLGNEIGAPSAVIYRACGARFEEESNWASDMFLYFNILLHNPHFVSSQAPLISIGIHEEQYTGTFQEKDLRKYRDLLLMYRLYDLQESEVCKAWMLRNTVEFGQGYRTARACGCTLWTYGRARIDWFWRNTILGYWNGLRSKLHAGRTLWKRN